MKTTFRSKFLALGAASILALSASAALATSATAPMSTPVLDAAPATPAAPAPSAEQMALAKAYIASVPVEDDVKAAVEELAKQVSSEQRVLFRSIADSSIDYGKLRSAAELNAAQIFTAEELKAMTAFFSSPEGRSSRLKMPGFEMAMQPVVTEVLQVFVLKLQQNNINIGQ